MISTVVTKTTILLELEQEEAAWLHAVMQNALQPADDPSNEPMNDKSMRALFFQATRPA